MPPRRGRGPLTFPPLVSHSDKTKYLSPSEAQPLVAKYVARSLKHAYCHPDSLLEPDGVQYGPKSGRSGGLVMHYLKRVEAGLRGEHLPVESLEELKARFGDDIVTGSVPQSDDRRLDETIRKKDAAGNLKRKRGTGEVLAWAENSSHPGVPPSSSAEDFGDLQPKEQWEQEQEEWIGEVGDREGAPMSDPNGKAPHVVQHDHNGNVKVPQGQKSDASRAARNAAKKLKKKEEKRHREEARRAAGDSGDRAAKKSRGDNQQASPEDISAPIAIAQDERMADVTIVGKEADKDALKKEKKLQKLEKRGKKKQSKGVVNKEDGDD